MSNSERRSDAEQHHRILEQMIPEEQVDDVLEVVDERSSRYTNRPSFSLPLMTSNFRRFNARYFLLQDLAD